ncbi:outer membrane protein assembly factor BamB family protein [Kitasatospora sp. NBC_00458]|uniref:outer membrane protein assembly factor BamB family protein n=1 Tax=Kitasatospora sp. NBC_00458 TaxID=2903568 RepID=UPI002E19DCCA
MNADERQSEPAHRHPSRRRLLLSAAGGAAALAAVGGAAWWVRRDPDTSHRLWSRTGTGGRIALSAPPRSELYAAGLDGTVAALDLRTGAARWSTAVGSREPANPSSGWPIAAGDGLVCVATDSHVQALDAASGALRWAARPPEALVPGPPGGLAVGGGAVLATYGDRLQAYAAATGEQRWSAAMAGAHAPVVADGTVYLAGFEEGVVALDAAGGERRWEQRAFGGLTGTPVVGRGVVHVTTADPGAPAVLALDAATGRVRWRRSDLGFCLLAPRSVADGTLCLDRGDRVTALDSATGETRWSVTVPSGLGAGMSSTTAADGMVYVALNDDRLHALDLASGRLRWRDEPSALGTEYSGLSLAAHGGIVYRGSRTGVYAAADSPA